MPSDLAPFPAYDTDQDESPRQGPHLTYLPGLDGLRALAVLAVLAYHAGWAWIPGGFLGVEVFFVISGYLITSLLLAERLREGGIQLGSFWVRRARRLLPALFGVLVGVTLVSVLFLRDEVATLRGDVLAALTYVTNWYQILVDQSYFEAAGRPPLLRHLWSLAVEEQFYLFWPLVFAAGLALLGRKRLLWGVLAAVAASTLLMVVLFDPDGDPTRVYYGTDTRAAGLFVGVALALLWSPWRLRRRTGPGAAVVLDVVGVLGIVGLAACMLTLGEFDPALYRGGFLVTSVCTAMVIAVVAHPSARLGRILGVGPLRWIGLRSYGIYLWHWPVFMLTRPDLDVSWPEPMLSVARWGLTFALAELSYRYLEMPVRQGAIGRTWRRVRETAGPEGAALRRRTALAGLGSVTALVLLTGAVVRAEPPPPPDWLLAVEAGGGLPPGAAEGGTLEIRPGDAPPTTAPETTTTTVAAAPGAETTVAPTTAPPPPTTAPLVPVDVGPVTALGDSVMLGAGPMLAQKLNNNAHVDASVGRQVGHGLDLLRSWRDAGFLAPTVIVHLGNNGTFTEAQFDQLVEILAGVENVVIVNNKVPRGWEGTNNEVIVNGVRRHPNVIYVDWFVHSRDHPEWFYDDGYHLRPEGQRQYVDLIAAALEP